MKIRSIRHNAKIIIGDYQFADRVKEEVLSRLKDCNPISQDNSNVKASLHTEWDWEPDNITFRNLKGFIREEAERFFNPGVRSGGKRSWLTISAFWANVYKKGDYAQSHCHKPHSFSFAYFVKAKWYDSPLIFTDSGNKIRPKAGRYVIFPGYLRHHVPKHRYNDERITLSGNFGFNKDDV